MITAGITAAIAGLLSLFGIKPGAYLVGVAIGVKVVVVAVSFVFGARLLKKRAAAKAAAEATAAEAAAATAGTAAAAKTRPDPGRVGMG